MLGIAPCELSGIERLAVDRNQPLPLVQGRILPHFEGPQWTDGNLAEHRDVDVAAFLDVVEADGLGVLAADAFPDFLDERVEIRRGLKVDCAPAAVASVSATRTIRRRKAAAMKPV